MTGRSRRPEPTPSSSRFGPLDTCQVAVADLVDNSLSAGARNIHIDFHWNGAHSKVAIVDDGVGMSEAAVSAAMRPGSRSPLEDRELGDLGRFGLGMKTASFSQARELTVTSKTKGSRRAVTRRWDLGVVAETGEWRSLTSPPDSDAGQHPLNHAGTLVQWTKLDRLVGN